MARFWFCCLFILTFSSVTQAKPAQRIIALAPHIVENLFAIGAGDRIVGTVDYADFPEQANSIERVGGHNGIALEKILALQPDIVIAWHSGNKKADLDKLEQLGIKVVYSDSKDISKLGDELRVLGQLTGLEKRAEVLAKQFSTRFDELAKQYQTKSKISVFYQLWPQPMMSINRNTGIHQLLALCGATNVFADSNADYPQVSIENVLKASPQVIILPFEKSTKPAVQANWQAWPEIPAVKNQHMIEVNADLLHRYSIRVLDGVTEMCDKLQSARLHYQQQ